VFALGVLLFKLIYKVYPPSQALLKKTFSEGKIPTEKLSDNDIREFEQSKANIKKVIVSDSLVELLQALLNDNPELRPTLKSLEESSWFSY